VLAELLAAAALAVVGRDSVSYSGLGKHCNTWQFWIICSVVLYGVEIPLSITERT